MKFIGRQKELSYLNIKYKSDKKEFGIIYGRRRIGKTALIEEFVKDKNSIFFQAKKTALYGNLQSFSKVVNEKIGNNINLVYENFEQAFDALNEYSKKERLIIVIDEYPYILEQMSWFSSLIQQFIDRANDNVFLILSGSDVSFLKEEIQNHNSPLYKRRTFEMEINKLSFNEACLFLSDFDNQTKSKYLSILSSYPYYLSSVNHNISFDDNLKNNIFNQYGPFFSLPDQILSNSLKVQDIYNAILEAITHRKRTNKEIATYIKEDEAKVAKYLITLQQSEIVEKCETFMGNKKSVYYQIKDNLLKFWYLFIFPNIERIKINGDIVFNELKEKIDLFIWLEFEKTSILYLDQLNRLGKLPTIFTQIKPYKVEKSKLNRSIEIDGLSLQNDYLLVMESKYRTNKFSKAMFEHLKESASVFPSKYKRVYYIFSKSGFEQDILDEKLTDVNLISLDDMFNN